MCSSDLYVRVDDAEHEMERCQRENTHGAAILAAACARHDIHLTTFSSDLVFDGRNERPYVESDTPNPLNVYGRSKLDAERAVLTNHPGALVVRTSAFFGPWDGYNFVTQALDALERGDAFVAASDLTISPTYVPDLVHACLDLAVDREAGIWHLANQGELTWAGLARRAAELAGVDAATLEAKPAAEFGFTAARPAYSSLHSERGALLPALDDALRRYVELRNADKAERCALQQEAEGRQQVAGAESQAEADRVAAIQSGT